MTLPSAAFKGSGSAGPVVAARPVSGDGAGHWLTRAESAAVAGAGALLGAYYLAPWLAVAALAALAFFVIAARWPLAGALWVLWTAPWYRFPKVFDAAMLGPLAGGRAAAIEVSVVETALVLTAAGWLAHHVVIAKDANSGPRSLRWWRTALLSPLGLLLVAAFVSLVTTENLRVALRELRVVIIGPTIFALVLHDQLRVGRHRWLFVHALVVLAAFVGTQGVVRYLTGAEVTEAEGVWRAGAIYWSPNHLALLLDRLAPLAAALAWLAPAPRRQRGCYGYAALAALATMALTFSRAGWLALGAVLVGLAASRDRRVLSGLLAAGLLAGGAALAFVPPERLLSAATSSQRVWLWQSSLAMLADHPITGVGLDNFLYQYPHYILPEAWREPELSHPHNLVLDFWLRLGILGTFALGWLATAFVRNTRRAQGVSMTAWERAAATGVAAAMAASVLHGLVDNSFFLIDLAYCFWALWMLQDSFARAATHNETMTVDAQGRTG